MTGALFDGEGGPSIFWRSWLPEASPGAVRGVVVIVHGAGEHSGRYDHVGARLVSEGFAVYALDHRGHGRSDGPRALIDRLAHAVADIDRLVSLAVDAHPDAPVFMLGHSMGGLLAVQYALDHQPRLAGLVLSGALVALDAASAPVRLAGQVLSVLAPRLGVIAVDSSLISRDPQVVAAYRADPLVHHGKLPARTVAELVRYGSEFPELVGRITVPALVMWGTEDRLCPPHGSQMLVQRLGADDVTARPYDGLYHEILNEPEQAQVLDDLCEWLRTHVAG